MALLAARRDDLQACPTHGPALLADGLPSVRTNGRPAARVGDAFSCGGCANRVKTGASTVTIGGEMAARLTDASDHGGTVILGSANVVIGGPTGMGCIGAGKSTCQAMAAGRKSGETHQSYGNCMVESVRPAGEGASPVGARYPVNTGFNQPAHAFAGRSGPKHRRVRPTSSLRMPEVPTSAPRADTVPLPKEP